MENVVGLLHGGLRLTFKLPAGFFPTGMRNRNNPFACDQFLRLEYVPV